MTHREEQRKKWGTDQSSLKPQGKKLFLKKLCQILRPPHLPHLNGTIRFAKQQEAEQQKQHHLTQQSSPSKAPPLIFFTSACGPFSWQTNPFFFTITPLHQYGPHLHPSWPLPWQYCKFFFFPIYSFFQFFAVLFSFCFCIGFSGFCFCRRYSSPH